MNILFVTLSRFDPLDERNIYADLVDELSARNNSVYVVCPRQRREKLPTELVRKGDIDVLRVKVGNIAKTKSLIERGISTVLLEYQYLRQIKKYYSSVSFDVVLYSTPPISFNKIVKYFKKKSHCITYLMLKDIFPQNAVDLKTIRKGSLIWDYFRKKEKQLYLNSDYIGCMSKANQKYIIENNDFVSKSKVEVFPNSVKPIPYPDNKLKDIDLLNKYHISPEKTLFIYGGNLGRAQGINFLLQIVDKFYQVPNAHLLIVGDGTEFSKLENSVKDKHYSNVSILKRLPKTDYDQLMISADVGLIFLDPRFTIPNFPSRLTSYMENAIPVLAATDTYTDLKDVLIDSNSGFWCESGDLQAFMGNVKKLADDQNLRKTMGKNGRRFLEENYDVTKTVDILLQHL